MAPIIGIDFDKCLAEAYTILPFVLLFEVLIPNSLKENMTYKSYFEKARSIFYKNIAQNEITTKGTIFRPSFLKLLPQLIKLRQRGHVNKMFIYSNNRVNELLNAVDHILALVLQEAPYNVRPDELIKEEDGRLHVLTPRIHRDNICRSSEPLEVHFREKTRGGIESCLGEPILDSDLWFIDDTRDHQKLMNEIGSQYVVVEPYTVILSNKVLTKLFIESFSIESFSPDTPIGIILLTAINHPNLMPGFRPTAKESYTSLSEKFLKVLRKFSPNGSGYIKPVWKEDHINKDLQYMEKSLSSVLLSEKKTQQSIQQYKTPIGGGVHLGRYPVASRLKRTRKLRKDRKNLQ